MPKAETLVGRDCINYLGDHHDIRSLDDLDAIIHAVEIKDR